jgi:hypothetical protein
MGNGGMSTPISEIVLRHAFECSIERYIPLASSSSYAGVHIVNASVTSCKAQASGCRSDCHCTALGESGGGLEAPVQGGMTVRSEYLGR